MSTPSTRMCAAVLRLTILLCFWLQTQHNVFAANVTVSDTDPSIVYSPADLWSSSSNLCSTCLNPGIPVSYHEGINIALSPDPAASSTSLQLAVSTASPLADSATSSLAASTTSPVVASTAPPPVASSSSPLAVSTTSSSVASPSSTSIPTQPTPNLAGTSVSPSTTSDVDSHGGDHGSGVDKRSRALARQLPGGSVDTPLTLSFNFTGTAIYLFCIQPPTEFPTNLSFTLDTQPAGNFSPTETSTEFLPNQNVLSMDGLPDQPHQLVVTVGEGSVFLFSDLIYTNSTGNSTSSSTQHGKKNNIATFAAAIGGSVGVLSVISLGIAISIIRRRMLAARRERLDNEANPPMIGPRPFVPRFFPDTIIPPDPPTYDDALSSTNHNSAPLLASLTSNGYSSRQRSYADIPPASPPPPVEELPPLPPPPPFPLPFFAPIPIIAAIVPSILADNQTPGNPDTGTREDTPLLQSSDSDSTRSHSRTSTRSLENPENSETNLQQENGASTSLVPE